MYEIRFHVDDDDNILIIFLDTLNVCMWSNDIVLLDFLKSNEL